jgi:uncharacterized membrane protein YheB (UPF0754 family)
MNFWFFLLPFFGAFVGWILNSLVLLHIFHPLHPKNILGFSFHGLVPKYQHEFAKKLGKLVAEKLFSFDELEQKIINPDNFKKVMPVIEVHVDEFLNVKLMKEMPFLSMFIGNKTISSLKKTFMQELEVLFPQVMKNYAANLKSEFDIEKIISQKIGNISPESIEPLFYKEMSKSLRRFKLIGAITGFIIGFFQAILLLIV